MARGKRSRVVRVAAALLLLAALAVIGAAIVAGGDPRRILYRDPPKGDYTWLRTGLENASEVTARSASRVGQAATLAAAAGLRRAIMQSRANARRAGTEPIPPAIREQLEDYFPEHVLDRVRWSYPTPELDLSTIITAWYRAEGGAVTLQDTIIYSTPKAAESVFLWSHELTHALQYDELGVRDFARIYVSNPQFLERQARDNAQRVFTARLRAQRQAEADARAATAAALPPQTQS